MRIIWLLTAAAGAAAIATAAPARPGGGGHGPGLKVGWSNGGGQHSGKGARTRFGIGRIEIDRRDRHRHRHHRWGRSGRDDFVPYLGGVGIGVAAAELDPWGDGYFSGQGGGISLRGGQPHFDYDRSYPFEWASAARLREPVRAEAADRKEAPPRCTFENGVRVCRGW